MGLVRARPRPALQALAAATPGVAIDMGTGASAARGQVAKGRIKQSGGQPKNGSLAQSWQHDAWAFFDTIGALKYAARFVGHALSRVKLLPAVIPDDGEDPVPVAQLLDPDDPAKMPDGIDEALCKQAIVELARLKAKIDGQAGLMRDWGINLTVAGDSYLVGTPNVDPAEPVDETWNVYSVTELIRRGVGKDGAPVYALAGEAQSLPTGTVAYRIYQPHPQRRRLADAPTRGILDDLEELALLNRAIRSTAKSRVAGAGMLLVPDELTFAKIDPEDPDSPDVFNRDLVDQMSTPLEDEASAANVVPYVVRGKSEFLHPNFFRHLGFDRPIDTQMVEQRKEKLNAIGIGLDLPPQVITGLADANHWSAWQVDESTYKSHIEPLLRLILAQLSATVFRDLLVAAGTTGDDSPGRWTPEALTKFVIIGDASALVDHPDQGADALKAYDAFELSGDALRRYLNFKDDDKPTPDEIAERVERQRLIHARGAIAEVIPSGDVAPSGPTTPAAPAPAGPGTVQQGPPPGGQPPPAAPPAAPGGRGGGRGAAPAARTAAGRGSDCVGNQALERVAAAQRPIGQRLARIDAELTARVHGMANLAVRRQLERAGAQITSKAQRDRAVADVARSVPKHAVAATVGQAVTAQLGLDDTNLAGDYTDLADQVDAATDRARGQGLALLLGFVRANGGAPPTEAQLHEYEVAAQQSRQQGRARLVAGLSAFTLAQLYQQNPAADDRGEGVAAGEVPPLLVRQSLATYGGQDLTDRGTPADGGPLRSGAAAGADNLTIGRSLGIVTDVWEWAHGSPLHPFEPHEELDGQVFGDDPTSDAERLANDDNLWTGSTAYWPGDHDGCTCWAIPLIDYRTLAPDGSDGGGD